MFRAENSVFFNIWGKTCVTKCINQEKFEHSSGKLALPYRDFTKPSNVIGRGALCADWFIITPSECHDSVVVFPSSLNEPFIPQEWEMRSQNHKSLIEGLTHHYKELVEVPGFSDNKQLQDNAKSTLQYTLHMLQDIVLAVTGDQVTKTKVILYQSIQDMVQVTLNVFPVYAHQPGKINRITGHAPLIIIIIIM